MNRIEFMRQLESLLRGISGSEREEALQYYNDYFDDAGVENEKDVIGALGTPAKVAEIIKSGLLGKTDEGYEFTDTGFKTGSERKNNEVAVRNENQNYHQAELQTREKKNMSPLTIILIILAVILLFPIWVPFVGAAFGILVAVLAVAFAGVFAIAVCSVVVLVVGIVLFVVGLLKIFLAPIASLCLIGTGMVLIGLGILFLLATTWLCAKAIPAVVRGIVYVCRIPFRRKEGQTA